MKRLNITLFLLLCCQLLTAQTIYQVYDTISIEHHNLYLDLRDLNGHSLKGKAVLDVQSKMDGLRHVPLQLLSLNVDSVWVEEERISSGLSYNGALLRIPLSQSLDKGDKVRVTVAYHGTPVSERFGGVVFNEKDRMAHNMGVSINGIPHSYGKSIYPCVDDFRAKSTYEMHVCCDGDLMAVCNGLLTGSRMLEDGSAQYDWSLGQVIPDYLVNFAVGPYRQIHMEYENAERTFPMDIYCLEKEEELARQCYSVLPDVMRVMEKHFGNFCFDRVGFVSVNSPGGAMEHATNISMPRNPNPSSSYRELFIHEFIHSWFGNRVTCESAEDMWLNEGLTTWAVETVLEELFPEDVTAYWQGNLYSALNAPRQEGGYRPLTGTPQEYTYSSTVYYKAAWVIRTLRSYIADDDLFFNALKKYVQDYTFKNANTFQFKASMEKSLGRNLDKFFQNMVDGPGFRALTLSMDKPEKVQDGYKVNVRLDMEKIGVTVSVKDPWQAEVLLLGKKGEKQILTVPFDFDTNSLTATLQVAFKPVSAVVDPEGRIIKAQALDIVQMGMGQSTPSRYTYLNFHHEKPEASLIYAEYLMAPPKDAPATYYWSLKGKVKEKITVEFLLNRMKDAGLYEKKAEKVSLLYRKNAQSPWKKVKTAQVDLSQRNASVSFPYKPGEYVITE